MSSLDRLSLLVHELRSPVAALQAIENTLRDAGLEIAAAERQRLLELAVAAGHDVERLLTDPDLRSVELEPVDVSALVAQLADERVEVEAAQGLAVVADPTRLRQALANLVANGLRHGEHVTVRAAAHGGEVRITVADDGPGVAPGIDPFARGVSGAGSTGLGLYVSRAAAEAHGGRLELTSAPGDGAAFTLALPLSGRADG